MQKVPGTVVSGKYSYIRHRQGEELRGVHAYDGKKTKKLKQHSRQKLANIPSKL